MGNVAVYKKGTTDFFSQGLGLLSDVVSSNLTQTVSSTGNVEQKLEVEYPIDGYLVSELVEGAILRVSVSTDKSDYGVFEIVDTLKDDSGTITIYGDPYYNRILRMSFDNGGVFTKFSSVQSALNAAKQNITGFPADFNLISNLSTSVDLSANTYDTFGTFLEALNSAVHGNIKYSLNSIQIYSALGKDITDITLRDDMNTSSVKITTDFSEIINKVIPVLPVLDKDGNATDKTKVGTIVTSKYSYQFLDYWAGKVIQFDTQDLANTYFDRTNADRPVQTVDVDPIGLDDDFSTINIFDTIELYSTRLDYTDKLRVSERVFDTLAENVTSFKLGSSSVNIFNQINEQNNEIFNNVVKLTNAAISANGKGIDYFGQAQPSSPKEGDTWFWDDGTDFGIKQYTNGEWVDLASSKTAEKIADAVTDAVTQAKAHTDEVKQGLSSDISTAKSQATSQANSALASAKSAATSQFNQAQSALSAAKTDLTNSIASEASARNAAVAAANSQAQTYANQAKADALSTIAKEVTDRQNAVSALDAKANNAVNQAKSDINDTINALSVGSRNYILDTANPKTQTSNGNDNQDLRDNAIFYSPIKNWGMANGDYIISFDWTLATALSSDMQASVFFNQSPYQQQFFTVNAGQLTGHVDLKLKLNPGILTATQDVTGLTFRIMSQMASGNTITYSNLFMKSGTIITTWTPAPEDVVLDYTTKDNKIKETISQYQTTNDGKVIKAQTDATTALGLVATKVSQTDYDKKTGDLTTKYTEVKQTVDSQATDIVDIKKTATSQASKINSISSDVDGTKQSISDIEATQDSQSDKINQITNDVNGTKQSITDIQTKDDKQDTRMGTIETSVSGVKSDFSSYKTTNDGVVKTAQTTAQTAVDGLKNKVSQTDYNAKTGQLQTDLTATTQTANQAKTDIVSIKQKDSDQDAKMNSIVSDANGTKQTVSDLQTAQGKQSGDISTLQQRADGFDATVTKVNNLSTGDRNYILDTANPKTQTSNGKDSQDLFNSAIFYSPIKNWGVANGDYIISFDWTLKTALSSDMQASVFFNQSPYQQQFFTVNAGQLTGHVDLKLKLNPGILTATQDVTGLTFRIMSQMASGNTITYSNLFMKSGTIITTWTPAPEDLSGATAKAQLTADNASAAVTKLTNADGIITKAQADIKANANAITQKVSQTDYDKKTGDLTTAVAKAQTTADGVVTTVGNYQTSNDKRVEAAESKIEQNSRDITARVSKTDYDNNNSQLSERFTKVEATADGASTMVGKLQKTVNSMGQTNLINNSEFSPDLQGWSMTGSGTYTTGDYDYSGAVLVLANTGGGTVSLYSYPVSLNGSSSMTLSWKLNYFVFSVGTNGSSYIYLQYLDSSLNPIPNVFIYPQNVAGSSGKGWTNYIVNGFTLVNMPAGAKYIRLVVDARANGSKIGINKPMLTLGTPVGAYVAGAYNNNAALAQVKITADSISNFVRDSSGNISSEFQTALSKTSIITGSTLAISIQTQTATQISSALTDNNGKIISLINQDSSGVQIAGKNIVLNGDTTVTGDFYAKGGNFKNLNASNLTVGTLNGSQVNITNINASNIVSGAISGANLNINLNTGSVVFQKGRINSSDYTTDINIDQGYISTSDEITRALLTQGKLQLIESTLISPQTNPYLEISNNSSLFNGMAALIKARDSLTVSINGYSDRGYNTQMSTEKFVGLSIGKYNGNLMPTKIGGAEQGVIISGGKQYNDIVGTSEPYIFVGSDSNGTSPNGNRIYLNGKAVHIPSAYNVTWSASANVYIASDGSLYRASSAKKYKQDIKHNVPLSDSKKLLEIPLSTWIDKRQYREKSDETRYFGMIAEDLRDAGLEYLVQYGDDNEVEGINYDRVALLLIPLVKELKEHIEELESKGK